MTGHSTLKTAVLLTALTLLLLVLGYLIGREVGLIVAFALALVTNFVSYWNSDKIALAMAGAKEVGPEEEPELHRIVGELASYARIPKPRVYVVNNPSPNAFATGRNPEHAAVAVTTGILRILDRDELAGVLSHELSHVTHRDTLIAAVVATIAGTVMFLASMARWAMIFGGFGRVSDDDNAGELIGGLVAVFVAPIAAMLIQLAISRSREYAADAGGARLTGQPLALASALRKLEAGVQARPMEVNPATSHMFIVNPFRTRNFARLFSTHPPTEDRIRRLEQMAYGEDASRL